MEHYLKNMLMRDEKIIYTARLHWVIYTFGLITLLIGAMLGTFGNLATEVLMGSTIAALANFAVNVGALTLVGIGALQLIFAFIEQISTELIVTNQRVFSKQGFIGARVFESLVDKVTSVNIMESMMGRWLGYGTVVVLAIGGDLKAVNYVADPYRFYNCVIKTSRKENEAGDKPDDDDLELKTALSEEPPPRLTASKRG